MIEVLLNSGAERVQPVVAQRQPDLQGAEAAGKLDGLFEKREALNRIRAELFGIVARISEGTLGRADISVEQAPAIEGLVQPFMRIERK